MHQWNYISQNSLRVSGQGGKEIFLEDLEGKSEAATIFVFMLRSREVLLLLMRIVT